MRRALTKPAAEHAFAGGQAPWNELSKTDSLSGITTYRTRCGLYLTKDRLVQPGAKRPLPCEACQAAREGKP